ncbi:J domain-containing protein [Acidaminococcus massiliensis]|uniref:J domain-containing protein n=1 Tax=Acidaminococcus massiliensis TaxID=1852375 RepID=UPI00248EC739|nr:J domain-containing protein [Acidaminococcus massiliensis]
MTDYYEILEVHPKASSEIIKKAYFTLAKKYHPDIYPDKKFAIKKMAMLNEAYEVLSNPEKRKAYDAQRNGFSSESNQNGNSEKAYSSRRNSTENTSKKHQQQYQNESSFDGLSPLQICIIRALQLAKENNETIYDPNSPLTLRRVNGIGFTLLGKKEEDKFSGSYITSYWLTFFWIPVFPFKEYRVLKPSLDSYIIISSRRSPRFKLLETVMSIIWCVIIALGVISSSSSKKNYQPPKAPYKATNKAPAKAAPVKPISKLTPKKGVVTGYVKGEPIKNNKGYSMIEVDNSKNIAPVYVRIWSLDGTPKPIRCFIIKEGEKFTAKNINPGKYDVRFKYLYEEQDAKVGAKSKPVIIEETQEYQGVRYTRYSLTLFAVRNGNTQMDEISIDEI